MQLIRCAILLTILISFYGIVHKQAWDKRQEVRLSAPVGYVLPSKFSGVLAVGNQGLLSDFLFLKTMTFIGERLQTKQQLAPDDWNFVSHSLDVVTDLDPYFLDPYILAQGFFPWDAGQPKEAIRFLKKGFEHMPDQWRLPFYIGFNYFYFLGDYGKGGEYIMEAAKIPGSHGFLPALAARLSYYGGKAKTAILFLRDMVAQTEDPRLRKTLELRIYALEQADFLETHLELYKKEQGRSASDLSELIAAGYIDRLPVEPYGGEWVILENGRVFSTSKFVQDKGR